MVFVFFEHREAFPGSYAQCFDKVWNSGYGLAIGLEVKT